MQLTISAYLIGFAVGQIFYGPLSDRHGRKPVLMGALALYCVASLACALSTSIEMLIVARASCRRSAAPAASCWPAPSCAIFIPAARAGRELSLIGSVMALAPVLAPIVGGVLQTEFGWRSIFCHAGGGRALPAPASSGCCCRKRCASAPPEPVSPSSMLQSYRVVARNPAYLAYLGLASTSYAGLFAWISGASFVLQNLYGLTPFDFGIAFALGSVGYMTGATLCGAAGAAARDRRARSASARCACASAGSAWWRRSRSV